MSQIAHRDGDGEIPGAWPFDHGPSGAGHDHCPSCRNLSLRLSGTMDGRGDR